MIAFLETESILIIFIRQVAYNVKATRHSLLFNADGLIEARIANSFTYLGVYVGAGIGASYNSVSATIYNSSLEASLSHFDLALNLGLAATFAAKRRIESGGKLFITTPFIAFFKYIASLALHLYHIKYTF